MRHNNIFIGDYIAQLEADRITPRDEVADVMEMIADKHGDFYDSYRAHLRKVLDRYDTREPIKEGRRSIAYDSFQLMTTCMPIKRIDSIESGFPAEHIPLGDGSYKIHKDFPREVREELELLHWCYIEMETVRSRRIERP